MLHGRGAIYRLRSHPMAKVLRRVGSKSFDPLDHFIVPHERRLVSHPLTTPSPRSRSAADDRRRVTELFLF